MKILPVLLLVALFAGCAKRQPPTSYEAASAAPPKSPQDFRLVYFGVQPPQTATLPAGDYAVLEKARSRASDAALREMVKPNPSKRSQASGVPLPPNVYHWEAPHNILNGGWANVAIVSRDGRFHSPKFSDARASKILAAQILRMEAERGVGAAAKLPPRTGVVLQKGFIANPDDPHRRPIDVSGLPTGTEFEDPYNPRATLVVP